MSNKKYTISEIIKTAEIDKISMIDATHIVNLLDETKNILKHGFNCRTCKHFKIIFVYL